MAAAMPEQSPYNYAFNNPVMFNDPLGDLPEGSRMDNLPPVYINPITAAAINRASGLARNMQFWDRAYEFIRNRSIISNTTQSSINYTPGSGIVTTTDSRLIEDLLKTYQILGKTEDVLFQLDLGTISITDPIIITASNVYYPEGWGDVNAISESYGAQSSGSQSSRSMTDFSNSNHALNIGGAIFQIMEGLTSSQGYWLGNNGKYYKTSWGGNQYTGGRTIALKYANSYKLAGKTVILAQVVLGGYMTYEGYVVDGGEFGYNSQKAAVSSVAGIGFGWAGAQAGAAMGGFIGSFFGGVGAIPGSVIGGVIGGFGLGLGGGYLGSHLGEKAVDYYHRKQ